MNAQQKEINHMCPGCALFGDSCPGTSETVWTGCIFRKPVQQKPICRAKLIHQPEANPDYPYNVQLWHSYDGGETFWYSGYGRFFKDTETAAAFCRSCETPAPAT